jgi:hypothetical protein
MESAGPDFFVVLVVVEAVLMDAVLMDAVLMDAVLVVAVVAGAAVAAAVGFTVVAAGGDVVVGAAVLNDGPVTLESLEHDANNAAAAVPEPQMAMSCCIISRRVMSPSR